MAEPRRVALLARPGEACERLRAALRDAGAEIVLEADPFVLAAEALDAAQPQAVLVALEPTIEDALDRFQAVLANPAVIVLFDEAELAARREGWEAARWVRHLAAKLHSHDDVLPPGREADPVAGMPGRSLRSQATAIQFEFDAVNLQSFVDEAGLLVGTVPQDRSSATRASGQGNVLTLVDEPLESQPDDPSPAAAIAETDDPATADRFKRDLEDLALRIAGIELVDGPQAARTPETARGAVLILAGIGGPDAVRQVLAGLPQTFPRPLLISQRLDGGRHDRLVQQMARATSLRVDLAELGAVALPGHVYIVPPTFGIAETPSGLVFIEDPTTLLAALPAVDSAVLLLSGSDPGLVDVAMGHAWSGALVAGQSPDGCYDDAAPNALSARGGQAGAPADLVKQLLQRWPS